jgi:hypothetical protein
MAQAEKDGQPWLVVHVVQSFVQVDLQPDCVLLHLLLQPWLPPHAERQEVASELHFAAHVFAWSRHVWGAVQVASEPEVSATVPSCAASPTWAARGSKASKS